MNETVKTELRQHVETLIQEKYLTEENQSDWHHIAFNENHYIVGEYRCSQWLKSHEIDPFSAINECLEWERDVLGNVSCKYDNAESVVNMLAYIYGLEVIAEIEKSKEI